MSFKQKLKSIMNKFARSGKADSSVSDGSDPSVAEITKKEVYPDKTFDENLTEVAADGIKTDNPSKPADKKYSASDKRKSSSTSKSKCACKSRNAAEFSDDAHNDVPAKPCKKRTRPVNPQYCMIDIDDNSCDPSKS